MALPWTHLQRDLRPPRLGHRTPLASSAGWFAKTVITRPSPTPHPQPLSFCQHLSAWRPSLLSQFLSWCSVPSFLRAHFHQVSEEQKHALRSPSFMPHPDTPPSPGHSCPLDVCHSLLWGNRLRSLSPAPLRGPCTWTEGREFFGQKGLATSISAHPTHSHYCLPPPAALVSNPHPAWLPGEVTVPIYSDYLSPRVALHLPPPLSRDCMASVHSTAATWDKLGDVAKSPLPCRHLCLQRPPPHQPLISPPCQALERSPWELRLGWA